MVFKSSKSIRLRLLLQPLPLLKAKPHYFGQLPHSVEHEDEKGDDVEAKVLHEVEVPRGDLQVVCAPRLGHQVDQLDRPEREPGRIQWHFTG